MTGVEPIQMKLPTKEPGTGVTPIVGVLPVHVWPPTRLLHVPDVAVMPMVGVDPAQVAVPGTKDTDVGVTRTVGVEPTQT